eukprot:222906-Chlamydomonas_euryale.AAC.1
MSLPGMSTCWAWYVQRMRVGHGACSACVLGMVRAAHTCWRAGAWRVASGGWRAAGGRWRACGRRQVARVWQTAFLQATATALPMRQGVEGGKVWRTAWCGGRQRPAPCKPWRLSSNLVPMVWRMAATWAF